MKNSLYPWKVVGKEGRFVETATGATLCEVRSRLDLPYHDPRVAETQLADASLIAAAPELLEACVAVYAFVDLDDFWREKLKAVIAKAEGAA